MGPFDIRAFEMAHVGVEALGYRIEAGGAVLAYTGDTGPCDAVIEMARDADVLMAEASYQDASELLPFHLSARQAAEHAKAAASDGCCSRTSCPPSIRRSRSPRRAPPSTAPWRSPSRA